MAEKKSLLIRAACLAGFVCERLLWMYQNIRDEAGVALLITHFGQQYKQHACTLEARQHFHCSGEPSHASRVIPACFKSLLSRSEPISPL
jgi:hypothetical protein